MIHESINSVCCFLSNIFVLLLLKISSAIQLLVLDDRLRLIRNQIQFYFDAPNYCLTQNIQKQCAEPNGYVPFSELVNYPNLLKRNTTVEDIRKAILFSPLVKITDYGLRPRKIYDGSEKIALLNCLLTASRIYTDDTSVIIRFFKHHGFEIFYVTIFKKGDVPNGRFKFLCKSHSVAKKCIEYFSLNEIYYELLENPIKVGFVSDYKKKASKSKTTSNSTALQSQHEPKSTPSTINANQKANQAPPADTPGSTISPLENQEANQAPPTDTPGSTISPLENQKANQLPPTDTDKSDVEENSRVKSKKTERRENVDCVFPAIKTMIQQIFEDMNVDVSLLYSHYSKYQRIFDSVTIDFNSFSLKPFFVTIRVKYPENSENTLTANSMILQDSFREALWTAKFSLIHKILIYNSVLPDVSADFSHVSYREIDDRMFSMYPWVRSLPIELIKNDPTLSLEQCFHIIGRTLSYYEEQMTKLNKIFSKFPYVKQKVEELKSNYDSSKTVVPNECLLKHVKLFRKNYKPRLKVKVDSICGCTPNGDEYEESWRVNVRTKIIFNLELYLFGFCFKSSYAKYKVQKINNNLIGPIKVFTDLLLTEDFSCFQENKNLISKIEKNFNSQCFSSAGHLALEGEKNQRHFQKSYFLSKKFILLCCESVKVYPYLSKLVNNRRFGFSIQDDFNENFTSSTIFFMVEFENFNNNVLNLMYVIDRMVRSGHCTIKECRREDLPKFRPKSEQVVLNKNLLNSISFNSRWMIIAALNNLRIPNSFVDNQFLEMISQFSSETTTLAISNMMKHDQIIKSASEFKDLLYKCLTEYELKPRKSEELCSKPSFYNYSIDVNPIGITINKPNLIMPSKILKLYSNYPGHVLIVNLSNLKYTGSSKMAARVKGFDEPILENYALNYLNLKSPYKFWFATDSQLKNNKCIYFSDLVDCTLPLHAPKNREQLFDFLGNVDEIYFVSKICARISHLFTSSFLSLTLSPKMFKLIPDIVKNNYNFSDGCGRISYDLAARIAEKLNLNYVPSVFQIRAGGIKGILSLYKGVQGEMIMVRNSMIKYSSNDMELSIVSWSKPSKSARLYQAFIQVLSGLGVKNLVFEDKQEEFVNAMSSFKKIINYFTVIDPFNSIFTFEEFANEPFCKYLFDTMCRLAIKSLKYKSSIPVYNSRNLIGIIDEYCVLREGEVFVQVTLEGGQKEILECPIVVSRSPVIHPGDIRILNAVNNKKLDYLSDCIVFSQQGDRPVSDMCSGGDLDGDMYLIVWDKNFTDFNCAQPKQYGSYSEPFRSSIGASNKMLISTIKTYVLSYMNQFRIGEIANSQMIHMDLYGINDHRSLLLSDDISAMLDSSKTGVVPKTRPEWSGFRMFPDYMNTNNTSYPSNSILGILHRKIIKLEANLQMKNLEVDPNFIYPNYEEYLEFAKDSHAQYILNANSLIDLLDLHNEFELIAHRIDDDYKATKSWLHKYEYDKAGIEKTRELFDGFDKRVFNLVVEDTQFKPEDWGYEINRSSDLIKTKDPQIISRLLSVVSAIYYVTYTYAMENSGNMKKHILSYPWLFNRVLMEIYKINKKIDDTNVSNIEDRVDDINLCNVQDRVDDVSTFNIEDRVDDTNTFNIEDRVDDTDVSNIKDRVDNTNTFNIEKRVDDINTFNVKGQIGDTNVSNNATC